MNNRPRTLSSFFIKIEETDRENFYPDSEYLKQENFPYVIAIAGLLDYWETNSSRKEKIESIISSHKVFNKNESFKENVLNFITNYILHRLRNTKDKKLKLYKEGYLNSNYNFHFPLSEKEKTQLSHNFKTQFAEKYSVQINLSQSRLALLRSSFISADFLIEAFSNPLFKYKHPILDNLKKEMLEDLKLAKIEIAPINNQNINNQDNTQEEVLDEVFEFDANLFIQLNETDIKHLEFNHSIELKKFSSITSIFQVLMGIKNNIDSELDSVFVKKLKKVFNSPDVLNFIAIEKEFKKTFKSIIDRLKVTNSNSYDSERKLLIESYKNEKLILSEKKYKKLKTELSPTLQNNIENFFDEYKYINVKVTLYQFLPVTYFIRILKNFTFRDGLGDRIRIFMLEWIENNFHNQTKNDLNVDAAYPGENNTENIEDDSVEIVKVAINNSRPRITIEIKEEHEDDSIYINENNDSADEFNIPNIENSTGELSIPAKEHRLKRKNIVPSDLLFFNKINKRPKFNEFNTHKSRINSSITSSSILRMVNAEFVLDNIDTSEVKKYFINNEQDIHDLCASKNNTFTYDKSFNENNLQKELYIAPVDAIGGEYGVFTSELLKKDYKIPLAFYGGERNPKKINPSSAYIFQITNNRGKIIEQIDAENKRDWPAFINHSQVGNTWVTQEEIEGQFQIVFYVVADIKPGEQILFDYGSEYFHCKEFKPIYLDSDSNCLSPQKNYQENITAYAKGLFTLPAEMIKDLELFSKNLLIPKYILELLRDEPNLEEFEKILVSSNPNLPILCVENNRICPSQNQQNLTAIQLACYLGKVEVIRVLLKYANADKCALHAGYSSLVALLKGKTTNEVAEKIAIEMLDKSKDDGTPLVLFPFTEDKNGFSILHYAIKRNCPKLLDKLIDIAINSTPNLDSMMFNKTKDSEDLKAHPNLSYDDLENFLNIVLQSNHKNTLKKSMFIDKLYKEIKTRKENNFNIIANSSALFFDQRSLETEMINDDSIDIPNIQSSILALFDQEDSFTISLDKQRDLVILKDEIMECIKDDESDYSANFIDTLLALDPDPELIKTHEVCKLNGLLKISEGDMKKGIIHIIPIHLPLLFEKNITDNHYAFIVLDLKNNKFIYCDPAAQEPNDEIINLAKKFNLENKIVYNQFDYQRKEREEGFFKDCGVYTVELINQAKEKIVEKPNDYDLNQKTYINVKKARNQHMTKIYGLMRQHKKTAPTYSINKD